LTKIDFKNFQASSLIISVKDKEHIGASHLASTVIKAEDLVGSESGSKNKPLFLN
jgi:hypothetical protein